MEKTQKDYQKEKDEIESFEKIVEEIEGQGFKFKRIDMDIEGGQKLKVSSFLNDKLAELESLLYVKKIEDGIFEKLDYVKIEALASKEQDPKTDKHSSVSEQDEVIRNIYKLDPEAKKLDERVVHKICDVFPDAKCSKGFLPDLATEITFTELKELEDARKALVEAAEYQNPTP